MTYPAYEKYKESGVPWLGQVPEGWEVLPVRRIARKVQTGGTPPSVGIDYFEEGEFNWYTPGDFWGEIRLTESERKINGAAISDGVVKVFPENTVYVVGIGTIGRVGFSQEQASANQQINAIISGPKIESKFLTYSLAVQTQQMHAISNATILGIMNQDKTKQIKICIPALPEQKAIAEFLDKKTVEIDALVAKKEELLKLLAEQRTALITHAVTKGLNPSAPMKDSGIDWLSHVPRHWDVKRLKFAVRLVNEKVEAASVDLAYMGLEQIESWTGKRIPNEEAVSEGVVNVFRPSDVLFGKLRPYLAKVYLAKENGTCSTEAFVLRSSTQLLPDFLQLYMLTDKFINAVDATTYGAKMPRANWESVGNLMMLLPPLKEQEAIVEHIRANISRIEAVINRVVEAIDSLKEYRTALITNAVTGKIKVI